MMRFSNPNKRSKFLKPKSASNTAVDAPLLASAIFAVKVVLPTPPLPEQINIVRVFSAKNLRFSNNQSSFRKLNILRLSNS